MEQIRTTRKYNKLPSYDILYEWEDQIAESLGLTFFYSRDLVWNNHHFFSKVSELLKINLTDINIGKKGSTFCFDMNAFPYYRPINAENVSTCIIDFYIPHELIPEFVKVYGINKKVFVSSLQAYGSIRRYAPEFEVEHMPLTLPDKYAIDDSQGGGTTSKTIDIAILGHTSRVLLKWLDEYRESHDYFDCWVRTVDSDGRFIVKSSKSGQVETIGTREDYFRILKKTKVVFYNTSGIDDSRTNTNGSKLITNSYHQVTPRFLEYISCGCNIISRYEMNEDVDYFELPKFTKNITDYDMFEKELTKALHEEPDIGLYGNYLKNHYTSTIIPQIKGVIKR